ncbi:hypothetical protein BGZ46_005848, partial [Entomortierella lignicola]
MTKPSIEELKTICPNLKRNYSPVARNEYCILAQIWRIWQELPVEYRRQFGYAGRKQLAAITGVGVNIAAKAIKFVKGGDIDIRKTVQGRPPKRLEPNYVSAISRIVTNRSQHGGAIT